MQQKRKRLGDLLVEAGVITQDPEIPVAHLVAGGTALFTLEDG